jgi:hypothetical protein
VEVDALNYWGGNGDALSLVNVYFCEQVRKVAFWPDQKIAFLHVVSEVRVGL